MPLGVEHSQDSPKDPIYLLVFKPLMPLGVEHIKSIKIDKTMLTRENFFLRRKVFCRVLSLSFSLR